MEQLGFFSQALVVLLLAMEQWKSSDHSVSIVMEKLSTKIHLHGTMVPTLPFSSLKFFNLLEKSTLFGYVHVFLESVFSDQND